MANNRPTGTAHRVSQLSHPSFSAEKQGFQVSQIVSHVGQHRDTRDRWDTWDKWDGWDRG